MQSLYSCKWICDFAKRSTHENIELLNRLLQQAQKAVNIREENRSIIIDKIRKTTWNIINAQNLMTELEAEIDLAMRLHNTDHPETQSDRYYIFDENGHMKRATREEYLAATPKDALETIEKNGNEEEPEE